MKISHYTVLGINQDASQQEIEAAYKRLSKELDPKNNKLFLGIMEDKGVKSNY